MPPGGSNTDEASAAPTGVDTVWYQAGIFAGRVLLEATTEGATASEEIEVGERTDLGHVDNHWGTAAMSLAISALAQAWSDRCGIPLLVNDMSLP